MHSTKKFDLTPPPPPLHRYVFEELSTFWSPETTFKAFAVCAFAALSSQIMLHSAGGSSLEAHVLFNVVDHTSVRIHDSGSYTVHGWTYLDLPFFAAIAVLCSLVSSFYTYVPPMEEGGGEPQT